MPADIGRPPVPLLLSRDARVGETAIMAGWGRDGSRLRPPRCGRRRHPHRGRRADSQTTFSTRPARCARETRADPILLSEGGVWAIGGVISANQTLACSFGDNFYANIRHPDISAFMLGRVPDGAPTAACTEQHGFDPPQTQTSTASIRHRIQTAQHDLRSELCRSVLTVCLWRMTV